MIRSSHMVALGLVFWSLIPATRAAVPADYRGRPFADAVHQSGMPNIPGIAYFEFEPVAAESSAKP